MKLDNRSSSIITRLLYRPNQEKGRQADTDNKRKLHNGSQSSLLMSFRSMFISSLLRNPIHAQKCGRECRETT